MAGWEFLLTHEADFPGTHKPTWRSWHPRHILERKASKKITTRSLSKLNIYSEFPQVVLKLSYNAKVKHAAVLI